MTTKLTGNERIVVYGNPMKSTVKINDIIEDIGVLTLEEGVEDSQYLKFMGHDFFTIESQNTEDENKVDITEPLICLTPFCGFSNKPVYINVYNLTKNKKGLVKERAVQATFSGQNNFECFTSDYFIQIDSLDSFNNKNAFLTLRHKDGNNFTRIPSQVKVAATTGKSDIQPKILLIGDSITNRGLGDIIKNYLNEYSYSPTFIGTVKGAKDWETSAGIGGVSGEAREGWKLTDFTQLTTRGSLVAVGAEDQYLNDTKSTQVSKNPFIRTATSTDPSSDVRNGCILDFEFYQTRFNLDTPDIVVIQLGTNDIRDFSYETLAETYESELRLLIKRLKASWSQTKIIVSLPNSASVSKRDNLWEDYYVPIIRKIMTLRTELGYIVCPSWALTTSDVGFSITSASSTVDTPSGAFVGTLADDVHPQFSARYQLAHQLAAYIACAADGKI